LHIHRFEQFWIIASILLIVGYIGTITYGALGAGVGMVGDEGGQLENPANPVENDNFKQPGVYRTGENRFDVYVLAQQFVFRPGTSSPITLPAGSTVTFHLSTPDVIHGFQVVDTNINTMAIPGQVGQFTVKFNEPRTYGVVCHEYCGVGHHLMEGQIKIVPPSEYEESQQ
jgi:cytochrome c oxidase subunit 2